MEEEFESYELDDEEEYEYEDEKPGIVRRFLGFLLRVIVVIVLGIGLGAGLFYGSQKLYHDFIATAQENRQRIDQIENDLALADDVATSRLDQLEERLVELEGRLAVQAEDLAALEARVESMRSVQVEQEGEVSQLVLLPDDVTDLGDMIQDLADRVEAIEVEFSALNNPTGQLGYRLQLIRAMTLITRARVSLIHDNLGLASEDISAAVETLSAMSEQAAPEEVEILEGITKRLDLALEDIHQSPVIAADELEIAWKLLIEATDFSALPTPAVTPTSQPTESATEEGIDGT